MQYFFSFSKTNEGNFKIKVVWKVRSKVSLVQERNRRNRGNRANKGTEETLVF